MSPSVRYAWIAVNVICALILIAQLGSVLNNFINPTVSHTWEKDLTLENMEFPVVFKICVIPGFNTTALKEAGYDDSFNYFLGRSRFNNKTIGWAGHSASNKNSLGSVQDILQKVKDKGQQNILKRIYVWTIDEDTVDISLDYLNSGRVIYPYNCLHLDLSQVQEMEGKKIEDLYIELSNPENVGQYSVEVRLKGRSLVCNRDIKDHHFYSSGDNIKFEFQKEGASIEYAVEINQRAFVEEDPSKSCKNYPTTEHETYEKCDDDYTRKEIEEESPGLVPIWMTNDLEAVSTKVIDQNSTFGRIKKPQSDKISTFGGIVLKYSKAIHSPQACCSQTSLTVATHLTALFPVLQHQWRPSSFISTQV